MGQFAGYKVARVNSDRIKTMRESRVSTFFFLALLVLLIYSLYVVLGGNGSTLIPASIGSGAGNPLEVVANSLRALGDGIVKAFSGLFH